MLYLRDDCVRDFGVAGFVFAMPEVEVGLMLVEYELRECRTGNRCGGCWIVAMGGREVVQAEDVCGLEHWVGVDEHNGCGAWAVVAVG